MAKVKGLAKAPAKGGDSKQGLVITLVFFVLLSIGFGVGMYYGFAGQKDFDDKAKKAEADKKSMESDRDWFKFQALMERAYITGNLSKSEEPDLPVLREKFTSGTGAQGAGAEDVNKLIKRLDETPGLGWDQNLRKVKGSLNDLVGKLQTDLSNTQASNANLQAELAQLKADKDSQRDSSQRTLRDFENKLKELNDKFVELEKSKSKEFVDLVAKNNEQLVTIEDASKKIAQMNEDFDKKARGLKIEIEGQNERYRKLQSVTKPPDMLAHESPRGKIVNLERKGDYAFINLGSYDHVHPQLTFSVFGQNYASDKAREKTRKARVEVVDIIAPHLSRARITDITDPGRDPVVTGDLLFNPAWSPSLKQHIAIAGLIDLTGDGTDNTEEFVRNLEKQNIAIDAVLDLKTMEMRGAMGYKTTYLVLGDIPQYEVHDAVKETDPRTARKREIAEKLSAIQDQAAKYGTTIVPAQRFMALIGYRVPKIVAPPDYYIRGARPAPKPPENGEGAKKPDAEPAKKEDMKDDKGKSDKNGAKEKSTT